MSIRSAILPLFLLASLAACTPEASFEPDPNRGPIGKADSIGSCVGNCDGNSVDCFCDDSCAYYGDCCGDKAITCDAPVVTLCGGHLGETCDSDKYCYFELSASCGWADATGTCQPKPEACIQVYSPVCGCDGQTYSNSCMAANAGMGVVSVGECEPQAPFCGGFGNIQCPAGLECVDDPNDSCDVNNGGADCGGMCVEPTPIVDSCADSCGGKSQSGSCYCDDGCVGYGDCCADIGDQCSGPTPIVNSCADSCGGKSQSGSCYCDDSCAGYGDCCADIDDQCSEPERVPASGMCIKNSNDECQTDSDCNAGGCGGELCFNPSISSGISTCECTAPGQVDGCGCVNGSCSWYNMQ